MVDEAIWPWQGRRWAHLVSVASYDELHDFASVLGLRRMAFQGDHYDVDAAARDRALELGATAVGSRELVRRLRYSGLRRRLERTALEWSPAALVQLPQMPRTVTIEILQRVGELALLIDRGGADLEVVIPLARLG